MNWIPPAYSPDASPRAALPEVGWLPVMREICDRHGLSERGLGLFASGSDVVFGGDGFVIKLTTPMWQWQIENERGMLERVAGVLPVETPRVIGGGEVAGWPYVVMTRLEGMRGLGDVWGGLSGRDRRRVAGEVGAVAAVMHGLGVGESGAAEAWEGWIGGLRESVGVRHRGKVPDGWSDVEGFVGGVEPRALGLGWLHTELLGDHVQVRGEGAGCHVAGMIDFADARVGHPDYEWPALVEFVFKGAAGCLRACLEGYGRPLGAGDRVESHRLAVWSLLHRYASLPRAVAAAGVPVPSGWGEWVERLYRLDG